MNFDFPAATLIAFLLALVRASAWLAIAPPFNSRVIPVRIKTGIAVALAIACAPHLATQKMPVDFGPFVGAVLVQVVIGLLLGFIAQLFLGAIQTAGALIDVLGGFSISQAYDPLLNMQNSVMGRLYQLLATTLLFATNGHLILIRGFINSFNVLPLRGPSLSAVAPILLHDLALFALAAVEIAGPLMAALFLAEVVLGIFSKAAPQMNIFMLGFPFKILLVLVLIGFAIPLLPGAVESLLNQAIHEGNHILKATG